MVADGMGGHAAGEKASRLAVKTVLDSLKELGEQPEQRIEAAITAANEAILACASTNSSLVGMGTTFTLVALFADFLVTGHIGDSMAFLIEPEKIMPLTSDHSVSGQLLALGKITGTEATQHPQRHVLTRALGIDPCPEVEVCRYPWQRGQKLLLCTDGLTEVVAISELHQTINDTSGLRATVKRLLSMVLERGAPDNVTIILAQL